MYNYNMEVVFNLADRYTGNVYATASQSLKGAGKTEQSAYNSAFSEINIRNGKYKVMMENGKTAIVEYFNSNCDPVISRGKSLADQHNWVASLGLLNSVPPVCRECYDEPGNNVKVSYSLGNVKPEKMFYFDVAETKAELMISGNIRIMGGDVSGDIVTNAVCVIPIKSKFDSPCAVTNLKLEWKEFGIILDLPVTDTYSGKGQHDLRVTIPNGLPISKVSNAVKPVKQLNGSILYNSVKTGKSAAIRIYRMDYTTGW